MAEQRTSMLDALRRAYMKDVLAVKFFLQQQVGAAPYLFTSSLPKTSCVVASTCAFLSTVIPYTSHTLNLVPPSLGQGRSCQGVNTLPRHASLKFWYLDQHQRAASTLVEYSLLLTSGCF